MAEIDSEKYSEWILDTIDQLRKRKARPDLERICHMVQRKHGPSLRDIATAVDKLVEAQTVVKVVYKGSTSYRNAAKWRKGTFGTVQNSASASAKIEAAVRCLTGEEGSDGECNTEPLDAATADGAVTKEDIERWLLEQDADTKLVKDVLQVALEREVDAYNLQRTADGKYTLSQGSKKSPTEKTEKCKNGSKADGKPKQQQQQQQQQQQHLKSIVKKLNLNEEASSQKQTREENTISPLEEDARTWHLENQNNVLDMANENQLNQTPILTDSAVSPSRKNRLLSTKRKRIKKSHGPDFEEEFSPPKAKRRISREDDNDDDDNDDEEGEVEEEEQEEEDAEVANAMPDKKPRCDFCLLACNREGKQEALLFCKDCPAKAHPSCMDYSEDLARRARNSPWQCIECKTCNICTDSRHPDSMLFCDACDKGYHMDCHQPPVHQKPNGKWVCTRCITELGITDDDRISTDNYNSDGGGASCLPTPTDSPVHFDVSSSSKMNGNVVAPVPKLATTMKAEVPDASDWNIHQVVHFFVQMGFSQQADVFKEQEIDGKSLLLMKRSDVLQGLGIKLGPALKIYAHIQRLQTRGQIIY